MKAKIVTLLLLCSFLSTTSKAQELVIDPALSATIVASTIADGVAYGQIEENQTENTTALAAAGVLQTAILEIKNTTLTALQELQSIFNDLLTIQQIAQTTSNTLQILNDTYNLCIDDPLLTTVIYDVGLKFIEECLEFDQYMWNFIYNLAHSELNLLNNAERLQIITYIKKEAFKLQGLANQMYYRAKAAKKYGLFRMLCPREFYYIRHCNQLATRIINNFHF